MYFNTLITSAALLAVAQAGFTLSGGTINGNVENGVATYNGYTCTGAIFVGCDGDVNNAFCCQGAQHAQNNICNGNQPTTCTDGSQVPLTEAASAPASTDAASTTSPASTSAQATAASGSSPSGSSSASSSASTGAAATANMLSGQMGAAGLAAVVVKVLFL